MRTFAALLLASTAFIAAAPAQAEDMVAADAAATDAAANETPAGEEIVIFGRGETRQVQELETREITILTPGTSPLKAIEKLPSVSVQNADPFGNYEWAQRVSIRSFNQNQLGFNFDGIPLGDMSYGNHNGMHISRAISSENVGTIRVSQGAGSIGTQATNNLGGTVETFSMNPERGLAGLASGTYGSDDTMRLFARINAGSEEGPRGYLSYGHSSTDKWRGGGKQTQQIANAKIVVPIGAAEIDGWVSYSDRREQDYQDMSLGMIERLGWRWDNTSPDWERALLYADIGTNRGETGLPITNPGAGTVYPDNVTTVDDAYYDASGLRKDTLAAVGLTTPIGETLNFKVKGYYHHNKGVGTWATPYVASPNGVPISMRTTEYDMDRHGVFGSLNAQLGIQDITVGGWYEHNSFNQARRFYAHASRTDPGLDYRKFPKNPFFTQWNFDYTTKTLQYFVQDRIKLGALTVNLGWKGFKVTNQAEAIIKNVFPEGKLKAEDWFQPHVGLAYRLSEQAELFGGFTQVTRAFITTNGGPFGTTQAGFDAIKDSLKPEKSNTFEAGLRYRSGIFNGSIAAYHVTFKNRLLGVASGPDILGSPSILQNVGSVRTYGFEAAGDVRLGSGFGIYGAYSYINAQYRDDVPNLAGGPPVPTKGKTLVDVPRHIIRGELTYDGAGEGPLGGLFGRIGFNYMSRRYYSYLNDASVPGRVIIDVTLGYRITEKFEVQLNASNLTDKKYVSTVGSAGLGNSGDRQTLLIGSPRQVFVTLKAGF